MKENKLENIIWIFFAAIGTLFFVIGISVCFNKFDYKNKIEIKGTITNIDSHTDFDNEVSHDVYVTYDIEGKKYESKLNGYSSNFYEGKEIDIYYDKRNPNNIGMKSLDYIFLIFPFLGLIFMVLGIAGIGLKLSKKNLEKKLKSTGKVIYADYIETILNTAYSINRRNPYNIICEWTNPVDNKKYIFKSKNIWINPENLISEKNITQFPVYIDENNVKKYIVDIDKLTNDVIDLR